MEAHFLSEVDRHVYCDESGTLASRRYGFRPTVQGFYVHPTTGLLRYATQAAPERLQQQQDADRIPLPGGRYYALIRDLWFIARYEELSQRSAAQSAEFSQAEAIGEWPNFHDAVGKLWICRIEKSCNKKDIQKIKGILAARR